MDYVSVELAFRYHLENVTLFSGKLPYWLAEWAAVSFADKALTANDIAKLRKQLEKYRSDVVVQHNKESIIQGLDSAEWLLSLEKSCDIYLYVGSMQR